MISQQMNGEPSLLWAEAKEFPIFMVLFTQTAYSVWRMCTAILGRNIIAWPQFFGGEGHYTLDMQRHLSVFTSVWKTQLQDTKICVLVHFKR